MGTKSINFIRRLNRGNLYFLNYSNLMANKWDGSYETYKISAQYLKYFACESKKNTGT